MCGRFVGIFVYHTGVLWTYRCQHRYPRHLLSLYHGPAAAIPAVDSHHWPDYPQKQPGPAQPGGLPKGPGPHLQAHLRVSVLGRLYVHHRPVSAHLRRALRYILDIPSGQDAHGSLLPVGAAVLRGPVLDSPFESGHCVLSSPLRHSGPEEIAQPIKTGRQLLPREGLPALSLPAACKTGPDVL